MKQIGILTVTLFLLISCQSNKEQKESVTKIKPTDRFKETIVESQFFSIDCSEDNVIQSNNGICVVIPQGSFIDYDGNTVFDSVNIEFSEASRIDELILSNLIINDSTNSYETKLGFFINATKNGQQIFINSKNPLYIELSSNEELVLLKGNRDAYGEMALDSIIKQVEYLMTFPFSLLNFYPDNFELEAEKGLPFKNHEILSNVLLDSLYYSFASELDEKGIYNWNSRFLTINILGMVCSFYPQETEDAVAADSTSAISVDYTKCGINPASIKALRTKKFENTFIATREFEQRLKVIYKTCETEILELYVNNLNKNLWEIDSLVAFKLGSSNELSKEFKKFSSYKKTNVKISENKAKTLANYYLRQKEKIEQEITIKRQELIEQRKKNAKIAQEKKDEYKQLLTKRQKYRNNKFGFELTKLGWYNASNKIKIADLEEFDINLTVKNGMNFDRVYSYIVNQKINSIFSLLSTDNIRFDKAFSEDSYLLLWKNQEFQIISIGFIKDSIGLIIENYYQDTIVNAQLFLPNPDIINLKDILKPYSSGYNRENKILVDLEYQAFMYKEKKYKERLINEALLNTPHL